MSFDIVKEESSQIFNSNIVELTDYIFTQSLAQFRDQSSHDYFQMVLAMLKNFGPYLVEKVPK